MLAGEAGIGKTTLARQLSTLSSSVAPAVWGVGSSVEAARPVLALDPGDPRPGRPPRRARGVRRPGRGRRVAAHHRPDLATDLDLPPAEPNRSDEGRFQIYDALLRLLEPPPSAGACWAISTTCISPTRDRWQALSYVSRSIGSSGPSSSSAPSVTSSWPSLGARRPRSASWCARPWASRSPAAGPRRPAHDRGAPQPVGDRRAGHPPARPDRRQPPVRLGGAQPARGPAPGRRRRRPRRRGAAAGGRA